MYENFIEGQVFIGMQFADMADTYDVLKKVCESNSLKSVRVDELVGSNAIIDDIKNLIEESEFLILDLTFSNINVYYEFGYADGVGNEGKDMLLLAKKGTELPFDARHRRVLFYDDASDLFNQLQTKLPQFIKDGRK